MTYLNGDSPSRLHHRCGAGPFERLGTETSKHCGTLNASPSKIDNLCSKSAVSKDAAEANQRSKQ